MTAWHAGDAAGPPLGTAVGEALGTVVTALDPVGGGCVSATYRAALADGRAVFVKSGDDGPPGLLAAEADGLAWLGDAGAVAVPAVLAVRDGPGRGPGAPRFAVHEWVEPTPPAPDAGEALGRRLAALHRVSAPGWGHARHGFIGPLPQDNTPAASWQEFWLARRLLPMTDRAVEAGALPPATRRAVERLGTRLDDLVPPEPAARLHGDLWSGNVLHGPGGQAVLIDPAPYGGHREVDLAMMRLFGGFPAAVFAAYEEAWPLAPGAADRLALWQLWPLAVHAVLFGGGYGQAFLGALGRYVDPIPRAR